MCRPLAAASFFEEMPAAQPARMGQPPSPYEIFHCHHRGIPPMKIFSGDEATVPVGTVAPGTHAAARSSSVNLVSNRNNTHYHHDDGFGDMHDGFGDIRMHHLHSEPIEAKGEAGAGGDADNCYPAEVSHCWGRGAFVVRLPLLRTDEMLVDSARIDFCHCDHRHHRESEPPGTTLPDSHR